MKKFLIVAVWTLTMVSQWAWADQITLNWNVQAGVTVYKIYQSVDKGVTWTFVQDATLNSAVVTVVGDRLVMLRVASVSNGIESAGNWKGAWYDGTKRTGVNSLSAD